MSQGANRTWRQMLVSQAALVWFEGRSETLVEFIETGLFGGGGEPGDMLPYNPKAMEEIAKQWKFGG